MYEDLMSHLHVSWVMFMYVMITNDYDDSYENGTQTRKSLLVCQDPLDCRGPTLMGKGLNSRCFDSRLRALDM